MKRSVPRSLAAASLAIATLAACSAGRAGGRTPSGSGTPAGASNSSNRPIGGYPHTVADVHFMSGMIPHHAQAVQMARWAPSHEASDALRRLCERIVVAQRDEIELMRTWLQDRGEKVPDADAHHGHDGTLMPGMLTAEQMTQLDRARGTEFDRLFLTFMIQHHEGAVTMVDALFASEGAGQDEIVFRLASDIYADQTTEIERMHKMLAALPNAERRP
ncbi:MAG: DUF305 domain-containing protein [Gemmatimonadaceae bacterium]